MSRGGFFASVGSVLKTVVHRHGIDLKLLEYQLRQGWAEIAGPQIAAHTRPDYIRFKKLYLIVENSVWLQHLTFLKPALLEKIAMAAGSPAVTDIVLRVGELQGVESQKPNVASEPSTLDIRRADTDLSSPEAQAQAAATVASVTDPGLRERLSEVLANALSSQSRPAGSGRADRKPSA
jgi:hypothetical protein